MNHRSAIEQAVARIRGAESIVSITPLSGGCIHHVARVELGDGSSLVAKVGSPARDAEAFRAESAGLEALARTGTIIVPHPIAVIMLDDASVFLMSCIPPGKPTNRSWQRLGEDLAALHAAEIGAGGRYGFDADNFLGTTPQPNGWMDDWVEFNRVHRLGHQVKLAASRGLFEPREQRDCEQLIDRLDQFIPCRPKPALLHGDLWSGNALPTVGARIAVIDPAVYVGDGWADIAMMRLFGGFPEATYAAYAGAVNERAEVRDRIAVYQLYHLLNHLNLFGRGYAGQVMSTVRQLA